MSITPFDADGRLDEAALRRHLRYLADGGVGVYLGSYGTGEGVLLRRAELRRLYAIGVEELKGRAPVYAAGLGLNETDYVFEANVAPRLCASVCEASTAGDRAGALERFTRLLRLNAALLEYATPRAAKAALSGLGPAGGYPRRPYLPLDAAAQVALAGAVEELGIREIEGLAGA